MFIAFEGIDGAGKTTQLNIVSEWLRDCNVPYFRFREPGGSDNAELIRSIFLQVRMRPISQLLLVAAARHENMLMLEKHKDKVVLVDRFIDSTYAYQGLELDQAVIDTVMALTVERCPDFTFLFLYQYRTRTYNHFDEMAANKLELLKEKFMGRYDPEKYLIVPGNKSINEISLLIKEKIQVLLGLNK